MDKSGGFALHHQPLDHIESNIGSTSILTYRSARSLRFRRNSSLPGLGFARHYFQNGITLLLAGKSRIRFYPTNL